MKAENYNLGHILETDATKEERCRERWMILEAIVFAIEHPMKIMEVVLDGGDMRQTKERIMEIFGMTESQAQAVIEMRLRTFTPKEKEKIMQEYEDVLRNYMTLNQQI